MLDLSHTTNAFSLVSGNKVRRRTVRVSEVTIPLHSIHHRGSEVFFRDECASLQALCMCQSEALLMTFVFLCRCRPRPKSGSRGRGSGGPRKLRYCQLSSLLLFNYTLLSCGYAAGKLLIFVGVVGIRESPGYGESPLWRPLPPRCHASHRRPRPQIRAW